MRKVVGKIIICNNSDGVSISAAIYNATGFIMTADSPDVAAVHALPAVALEYPNFEKLVSYHSSARYLNP